MATNTYTSLASASPTIIVSKYLKWLNEKWVMMPRVTRADQWPGAQQYGHQVSIPTATTRASVTQLNTSLSAQGAEDTPPSVTYSAPTISSVTLVIDQWWYIGFQRTVFAEATAYNAPVNWDPVFKQMGMDALNAKVDATLTDLLTGYTGSGPFGQDGSPVQIQDVLDSKKALDTANVPETDRTWVFSAGAETDLLNLDVIANQLYGTTGSIPQGKLTKPLYGSPAFFTTNLTAGSSGKRGGYFQREAMAIAMRRNPMAHNPGFANPAALTTDQTFFAIWGVKELRDNHGVEIKMAS